MSLSALVEAELNAMKRIEEAKNKARVIIREAEEKAKEIRDIGKIMERVERYINEEERKLRDEAKKIYESYLMAIEKIKRIPLSKLDEVSEMIIKEVLGIE